MPGTLPLQRELLTNIVHALCEAHHNDGSAASKSSERHGLAFTKAWESSQRKTLILTLHVIFPGMLLPALDLLDRNLVRRLALKTPSPDKEREQDASLASSIQPRRLKEHKSTVGCQRVYTARSAASTLPRRGAGSPGASARVYLVHLDAWSCSCAGFAVDAYAAVGRERQVESATGGNGDAATRTWKFGGSSTTTLDAQGAEAIPCCKHLLACLLVDEWEDLLAAHVEEKSCTKEEMAGIVAGI
ncbi:hypothetical protein LLEC1_00017 [Akanthomyces lecanii]|uniref:SWIM-type domain-containing protein n=1 Tax=Cordyceps confragosa TaxID=2714763 RepID=A0A179I6D9_CORDF|nr:hypothetical protein LLEC1_00017 [Akanthomyces lecanii]